MNHHPWGKNLSIFPPFTRPMPPAWPRTCRPFCCLTFVDLICFSALMMEYIRKMWLLIIGCSGGFEVMIVMVDCLFFFPALLVLLRDQKSSKGNPGPWQLKYFFNFHPYLEKWSNLTFNIFQMGWLKPPTRNGRFLSLRYPKNWQLSTCWSRRSSPFRAP